MPDELILGPILGVDENKAMIWFKATPETPYCVKYAEKFSASNAVNVKTGSDAICVCTLNNLKPNTEYDYVITDSTGLRYCANGRFATFPSSDQTIDFSFGFYSCHKPAEEGALKMWDRLSGICHGACHVGDPSSLRFLLPIGDQIYADELDDGSGRPPTQYLKEDEDSLTLHYESRYNFFWAQRSVRDVLSRCPVYMMWDDHEIRDGWGSRKNDLKDAQLLKVFKAAEEAFIRHQLIYNPFCPDPSAKKYYAFRFAQTGFIVLDLRSERNANSREIMSPTQWAWFETQLNSLCVRCKAVFVVTTVPFYHPVRGFAKAIIDLKNLISKDELEDSWGSKQWQNEGIRFAKTMFDAMGSPGHQAKLFILGGDAHIATCAEIRLGTDMQSLIIPQFTSSAISNAAPPVVKRVHGNIQNPSWKAIYDHQQYEGRIPHLIAARNFGIVRITNQANGMTNVRYDLQHENSDAHVILYDGKMILPPVVIV